MDTATGEIIQTWKEVTGLDEILVQGATVFVINRPKSRASYDQPKEPIWEKNGRISIEFRGEVIALDQKSGNVLWRVATLLRRTFSVKDGEPQAEITLSAQPVFDGMVAGNGNLYIPIPQVHSVAGDRSNETIKTHKKGPKSWVLLEAINR